MPSFTFIRIVGPLKWLVRYSTLTIRKHLLKIDSYLLLPTGTIMLLPRHSQSSTEVYVTNADIDWGSEALFARFATPNRDFLDIGAHVGYYSCYLSTLVRRVYAFEPDLRNIPSLRCNASTAGNVEVLETAVSSIDGTASLHQGHSSEVSSLVPDAPGRSVKVRITSIDTFTREHPYIDVCLVKIDAEGHDIAVLYGMEQVVVRNQPLILCECDFSSVSRELCAQWRYEIFAFTCDRSTLKMNLEHFTSPSAERLWYKMLFMVPPHLMSEFTKLAAQPRTSPAAPKTHPAGSAGALPSASFPASSSPVPPCIISTTAP
jgi:FkbM family methyltransferase